MLNRRAVRAGLDTVALTDHDSTAGWSEATAAVAGTGLTLLPGMELSTRLGLNSVHMLGYLFDPAHPGLVAETARHAGHADVVRELLDGAAGLRAGGDNLPEQDEAWWRDYRARLEQAAEDA